MNTKKKNLIGYSVFSIGLFVFMWWLATEGLGWVSSTSLAGPIQTFKSLIVKLYDTNPDGYTMQQHIASSLMITFIGYLIGSTVGNILGILMGWYEKADMFIRPIFDLIKPVPGIAWVPLFITLLGIGILPQIIVISLSALIPTIVNSSTGIRQTKEVHIWVAQTFGATKFETLCKVAVPSAIPYIMTGLKVALAVSWATIVGAEMFAAKSGLGYLINLCRGIFRTDIIIAGMICIGVVGAVMMMILSAIQHQLMKGGKW